MQYVLLRSPPSPPRVLHPLRIPQSLQNACRLGIHAHPTPLRRSIRSRTLTTLKNPDAKIALHRNLSEPH